MEVRSVGSMRSVSFGASCSSRSASLAHGMASLRSLCTIDLRASARRCVYPLESTAVRSAVFSTECLLGSRNVSALILQPGRLQVSHSIYKVGKSSVSFFRSTYAKVASSQKRKCSAPRSAQAERAYAQEAMEEAEQGRGLSVMEVNEQEEGGEEDSDEEEAVGEVNTILGSRVVDRKTEYLIEWKDGHPDSWEPAQNIARDLIAEYETPWWQAARKPDAEKLSQLLEYEGRDINSIDENERTALLFAAGLGSEKCVRQLVEAGADVAWQDKDGFTALHLAAGYVHTSVVKALLELGADPEFEDSKGRSVLCLAQELLQITPKANPLQFARRLALDQVVKLLDEALYENVEVEQVLDKRVLEGGTVEFLVRWSDGSEESWVAAENVGEDLVKDYELGLEYGIAEKILDKRIVDGKVEYLVQWADKADESWEPEDNVSEEVVAEFVQMQKLQQ